MSPARRKLVTLLAVGGFVFSIGGVVFNLYLLSTTEEPNLDAPLFSPPALVVIVIGACCFVLGAILGWGIQGTRDTEIPPSLEPKTMVLRMPSNRNYSGTVTLKVRNGDNHEFDTHEDVMQILVPGMIGTAKIHGRKLLSFEPDREQPNLKSKQALQSVDDRGSNQP